MGATLARVLFFLIYLTGPLFAQTGVVVEPVNLWVNPQTDNPPIRLLLPPETFRLTAPKEQGSFYHVQMSAGETGWVWKQNVRIYDRDSWKHWIDADKNCRDARQEVLIQESTIAVTFDPKQCRVVSGRWVEPYGGEVFTDPSQLQIDHVVPLANAHISGAWAWTKERKEAYANDLVNPEHLLAVKGSLNQSKSDKSPDKWKPPRQEFWCEYATMWLQIKDRWGLTLTASEAAAVAEMKRTCP